MFPNTQSVLPLPPLPNIDRYRKLAKELVNACKSGDEDALTEWAERWIHKLAGLSPSKRRDNWIQKRVHDVEDFARRTLSNEKPCALTAAQFVIARSHGFESWPKFSKAVDALVRAASPQMRFEAAADAVVEGDLAGLKRLLRDDPTLARATSSREHGATLLIYTSANGVEGYRQKTPKNIVAIARLLLDAGSDVEATAHVYGGGCTTLGLVATSAHPKNAGSQEPLMQLLLDRGARMDGAIGGNNHSLIVACLANGTPKAAQYLMERGAPLDLTAAAGAGNLDAVKSFFDENGALKPTATRRQQDDALLYAVGYGHKDVVEFLLEHGADLSAHMGDGQTALHWAAFSGRLETMKLLLQYHPPLDATNRYGGDVWGQTIWSAGHGGDPDLYLAMLEVLHAAGARPHPKHVPITPRIDAWLEQFGSFPEPAWYWYGEEPRRKGKAKQ